MNAEERKEKVKEMYLKGYSLNHIARTFNVSTPTISYLLNKEGIKPRDAKRVQRLKKIDIIANAIKNNTFTTKSSYFANMKMVFKYLLKKYQNEEDLRKELSLLLEIDENEEKLKDFVRLLLENKEVIEK